MIKYNQIIQSYHDGKSNHPGILEIVNRIKLNYYWANQIKLIQ